MAGLLLLGLCWGGCATPPVPARAVYEDPVRFIRLERDPDSYLERPTSLHSHPARIKVEEMVQVLEGLQVRDHRFWLYAMAIGQAEWRPVFTVEEVALLAKYTTAALEKADATERVAYYLSEPQSSIKREITTGGLYLRGTKLHFVLSNHHTQYGVPSHGLIYDRRYPTKPTTPKWFDLTFDPVGAVEQTPTGFFQFLFGEEQDEIVIDLAKLGHDLPVVRDVDGLRNRSIALEVTAINPHVNSYTAGVTKGNNRAPF